MAQVITEDYPTHRVTTEYTSDGKVRISTRNKSNFPMPICISGSSVWPTGIPIGIACGSVSVGDFVQIATNGMFTIKADEHIHDDGVHWKYKQEFPCEYVEPQDKLIIRPSIPVIIKQAEVTMPKKKKVEVVEEDDEDEDDSDEDLDEGD